MSIEREQVFYMDPSLVSSEDNLANQISYQSNANPFYQSVNLMTIRQYHANPLTSTISSAPYNSLTLVRAVRPRKPTPLFLRLPFEENLQALLLRFLPSLLLHQVLLFPPGFPSLCLCSLHPNHPDDPSEWHFHWP